MRFTEIYAASKEDDIIIEDLYIEKEEYEDYDFKTIELENSSLKNVILSHSNFSGSTLKNVTFIDCDLSNCNFKGSYLSKCTFKSCKCIGINLNDSIIKDIVVEESILSYSSLDETKIEGTKLLDTDFNEASISNAKIKKFHNTNCTFTRVNFFKTSLKDVDFSKSTLMSPIVSDDLGEFKRSKVSQSQAINLIGLLGIEVKEI